MQPCFAIISCLCILHGIQFSSLRKCDFSYASFFYLLSRSSRAGNGSAVFPNWTRGDVATLETHPFTLESAPACTVCGGTQPSENTGSLNSLPDSGQQQQQQKQRALYFSSHTVRLANVAGQYCAYRCAVRHGITVSAEVSLNGLRTCDTYRAQMRTVHAESADAERTK